MERITKDELLEKQGGEALNEEALVQVSGGATEAVKEFAYEKGFGYISIDIY